MGDESPSAVSAKSSNWLDGLRGKLLLILIAAALGAFVNETVVKWNGRLRYLTYAVQTTSPLIQRPDLHGKQFKISVDGAPVDNLSTVAIYLINSSGEDFSGVPVDVSLSMPDGSPVQLLQETVQPDRVSFAPPATMPVSVLKRTYTIEVANRQTNSDENVLLVQYVFSGASAPSASLNIAKVGLKAVEGRIAESKNESFWPHGASGWSLAIVGLLMCIDIFITSYRRLDKALGPWGT